MNVKFLNLSIADDSQRELFLQKIDRVLKHGQLILGPEVIEFEKNVQNYYGVKKAIGVSSGTDALYLALRAFDIGTGDEVITSSISFVASANAISLTGATPVFADVNDDFNINPKSIERLITDKTKAIMPIHYGGKIADMDAINQIAKKYNLKVIEDASQAFGATYNGKYAGTLSDVGAISLNSMKILAALGDAGLIVTDDVSLYDKLLMLRYNGLNSNKICEFVSTNAKMDTIQATVLIEKLKTVDTLITKRRVIADTYNSNLFHILKTPTEEKERKNVYFTYTIVTDERDALYKYLISHGIEVKVYHTNLMDEIAYINHKGECDNARVLSKKKLALPCHENMTESDIHYVISTIKQFYKSRED